MSTPPGHTEMDFDTAPLLVFWETTRACDLSCGHCRADANLQRHPRELTTAEAEALLRTVRRFGRPLVVLTGGDPLKRPDVVHLVRYGSDLGLRMALTPSGTSRVTTELIMELKKAGLSRLALSLDGSTAAIHDTIRGVPGSFSWTVRMLRDANDLGVSTQVNTTITRHNLSDLESLYDLMADLGIAAWAVFFLVPVGRARAEDLMGPEDFERALQWMYDRSRTAPFAINTIAAPQYRRVIVQRRVRERRAGRRDGAPTPLTVGADGSVADAVRRARNINAGDGQVFVSHTGEIFPSGFLPVSVGNVRRDDLVEVYRTSPLFRSLRNRDALKGKCGVCEYRAICGGSRARAYALTGDWFAPDPCCAYRPVHWRRVVEGRGVAGEGTADGMPHCVEERADG